MAEHEKSLPRTSKLRLALYEPDIPQNAGTLFRLSACMGIAVDLIEPAGFDASDRNLRRSGLDYLAHVQITRHLDFAHFERWREQNGHRLVLATTHGAQNAYEFAFQPGDILMLGRESAGAPPPVHAAAQARIALPLAVGLRSLNIAVAGAMLVGEALRQLDALPPFGASRPDTF